MCWTFLTSFGLFMRHLQAPRPKRGSFKFKYVWAEPILLYIYIIQAILTQYDAQIWQQMRWTNQKRAPSNKKGLKITLFSLHLKIKQGLYCQHPRDFYYTAENVNTPTRRLRYSGPMNEQDECVACFWLADFIFGSIRQARICPMVVKIEECRLYLCRRKKKGRSDRKRMDRMIAFYQISRVRTENYRRSETVFYSWLVMNTFE